MCFVSRCGGFFFAALSRVAWPSPALANGMDNPVHIEITNWLILFIVGIIVITLVRTALAWLREMKRHRRKQ